MQFFGHVSQPFVSTPSFRCVFYDLAGQQNMTTSAARLNEHNILQCIYPPSELLIYYFIGVIKCITRDYDGAACTVNNNQYFIYPLKSILVANLATVHLPINTQININDEIKFEGLFDPSGTVKYFCQYIIGNTVIDLHPDTPHAATGIWGKYASYVHCNTTGIVPFNTFSAGQQIDVNFWQIVNNEQNEPIRSKIISIPFIYGQADKKLSKGALIGIIIGSIVGAILIIGAVIVYCRRRSASFATNTNKMQLSKI
jgi:hypothetical protein